MYIVDIDEIILAEFQELPIKDKEQIISYLSTLVSEPKEVLSGQVSVQEVLS